MRVVAAFASAFLLIGLGIAPGHADRRVALVIGNSSYQGTAPLPNPKNDAADMAAALQAVGFETIVATDLDKHGMDEAFRRFARLARDAEAALFFYAGHGMQFAGTNYLMPVDAKLQDEADVPYELAKVDDVIADLSRAKNIRIVILDACRDNPMAERLRMSLPASRSAAVSRGLARIERSQGLITAFATQPGQVAADGFGTRNSPFTATLLKHIATPGVEAGTLFRRVAQEVNQSTGGKQLPELSVSLLGEFYFAGPGPGLAPAAAPAPSNEAAQAWVVTQDTTSVTVLEEFIRRFGDSFYAALARARLEELKRVAAVVPPAATRPKITDRIEPGSQATPAPEQPGVQAGAAVAQKVVLYEEDPADPNGKRFVGSAIWHTETVTPGPGQPPELAVRADVEVPERKLTMTWSLRRNTDKSLPASHTVEIIFKLPPDFPSGGISNVPGILMKQAEQTRGVPLAGLAVKVTNGFFLIGLSSVEAEKERNLALLKERSWFDIPVVYNNNRRAILAMEKGNPGERVFAEAFKVWKQ
jgi:uncharacterized caspase-like protein